jgi:hypothetical protein
MARAAFSLGTEHLGPLPLVDYFIARLGIDTALDRAVPTTDRRARLASGKALAVPLRSMLVDREPTYRQHGTVAAFGEAAFRRTEAEARVLDDDQVGRALDRVLDADCGALVTEVVLAPKRRLRRDFGELHNDSTTVLFAGQYREAKGRTMRGKRAPIVTLLGVPLSTHTGRG